MARSSFRRAKAGSFAVKGSPTIDYKNVRLLKGFVEERGKITSTKIASKNKLRAIIRGFGSLAFDQNAKGVFVLTDREARNADRDALKSDSWVVFRELTGRT
ncbi:MAG: hypothetical protein ACOYNP_17210 [Gemmataceae bacterium]